MKYIFFLCVVSLFCFSCESWLQEEPKAVSAETFYNTPAEAAAAVLAPLNKFRSGFAMSYPGLMECFADYQYGRGSWASNSNYVGLDPQNVSRSDMVWNSLYQAIRDCNIAIDRLPRATQMTESQKNAYLAELRFLRAFAYFNLVRLWDAVPLRTETNMAEWDLGKSSAQDIYALIVSDLEFAKEHAPARERLVGTPSSPAAKSLLAHVYLELKDYTKAAALAKEVIDSKRYALVPVAGVRDFEKIYGPDVVSTTEEVFYLKSTRTAGWEFVMFCSHPNVIINGSKMHGAGGWFGLYTRRENKVFAGWDDKDLRKDYNTLKHDLGLGFDSFIPVKFYDPLAPGSNTAGNSNPVIRYADVLLIYAEAANELNNGPTQDAVSALNQIRRRAYGHDPLQPSSVDYKPGDFSSRQAFLDKIVEEQAYESWNEGKRWLFLKRLGIAGKQVQEMKGITIQNKHYLFPIPASEFNYNKGLDAGKDQNPGY